MRQVPVPLCLSVLCISAVFSICLGVGYSGAKIRLSFEMRKKKSLFFFLHIRNGVSSTYVKDTTFLSNHKGKTGKNVPNVPKVPKVPRFLRGACVRTGYYILYIYLNTPLG